MRVVARLVAAASTLLLLAGAAANQPTPAPTVDCGDFCTWGKALKKNTYAARARKIGAELHEFSVNMSTWVEELENITKLIEVTEDSVAEEKELVVLIEPGSDIVDWTETAFRYVEIQIAVYFLSMAAAFSLMVKVGYVLRFSGMCQAKHALGTIFAHVVDVFVGIACWWICGYGLAFGADDYPSEASNGLAGRSEFGNQLHDKLDSSNAHEGASSLFHFALMLQSFTIFSGALLERQNLTTHMLLVATYSALIWPIVCHSIWSPDGIFSAGRPGDQNLVYGCGTLDYLGSGTVHMAAGIFSIPVQYFLGPRLRRWNKLKKMLPFVLNSPSNVALGTYMIIAFSVAVTVFPHDATGFVAQANVRAGINVIFAVLSGGVTAMIVGSLKDGFCQWLWSTEMVGGGMLAGMAAISGGAPFFDQLAAVYVGGTAGMLYVICGVIQNALMIDDTATVLPIHFMGGMWGMFAVGLFVHPDYYYNYYKDELVESDLQERMRHCAGLIYPSSSTPYPIHQLKAQIIFMFFEIGLILFISYVACQILNEIVGLRMIKKVEVDGVDRHLYGGLIESVPIRLNATLRNRKWVDIPSVAEIRKAQEGSKKCERIIELSRVIAKKVSSGQKLSPRERDISSKYMINEGLVYVKPGKHMFTDPVYDDTECSDLLFVENPAGLMFIPSDCYEMQKRILHSHVEVFPIGTGVHAISTRTFSACEDVLRSRYFWPSLFMHNEIKNEIEEIEAHKQAENSVDKYVCYGGAYEEEQ